MPNPVKGLPVEIDVLAHPPGAPEPYTLDWKFQGGTSKGNTAIDLPRGSGSHDMTFTLCDSSGKGLRFKPAADEAIWVSSGSRCPNGKGNGKSQIGFGSVSADGLTLTINDDNSGSRRNLRYMLRFDPDPNVWDPDIRNGGGGTKFDSTMAFAAIVGGVAGAAATLLAYDAATTTNVAVGVAIGAVAGIVLALIVGGLGGGAVQSAPPA